MQCWLQSKCTDEANFSVCEKQAFEAQFVTGWRFLRKLPYKYNMQSVTFKLGLYLYLIADHTFQSSPCQTLETLLH